MMTITNENRGLIRRVGPLEIDWPKCAGYFGAIGLAVAWGLIALPIGLFIAAIPVIKLFKQPGQPWPVRIVADALEGAAKPVGGDSEAMIRLAKHRAADEKPAVAAQRPPRAKKAGAVPRATARDRRLAPVA